MFELTNPTLLVVDDDHSTRRALVRALDGIGTLLQADCAEDALEVLANNHVDVILSDHDMPGMCGLDLLRTVRLRWPLIQRLIVTATKDFDVAVRAINLGEVERFVTKPWRDDELQCAVNRALDHAALENEVRALRKSVDASQSTLRELELRYPGITRIERDARGAILLDETAAE